MKNQIHDYLDHELKNLNRFRTIHPITALHHIMESMIPLLRDEYPDHPMLDDFAGLTPIIMEWNTKQQKRIYNVPVAGTIIPTSNPTELNLPKLTLPKLKKL